MRPNATDRLVNDIKNNTEYDIPVDFNPNSSEEWYHLDGGLFVHKSGEAWVRATLWQSAHAPETVRLEIHNAGSGIEIDGRETLSDEYALPDTMEYDMADVEAIRTALCRHIESLLETTLGDYELVTDLFEAPRNNTVALGGNLYRFAIDGDYIHISFEDNFAGLSRVLPENIDITDSLVSYIRTQLLAENQEYVWRVRYELVRFPEIRERTKT